MPIFTDNQSQTPQRRYPWRRWFQARTFTIRRGRDYVCRTYVMAQMVRNVACRLGYSVSIAIHPDERALTARLTPLTPRMER